MKLSIFRCVRNSAASEDESKSLFLFCIIPKDRLSLLYLAFYVIYEIFVTVFQSMFFFITFCYSYSSFSFFESLSFFKNINKISLGT